MLKLQKIQTFKADDFVYDGWRNGSASEFKGWMGFSSNLLICCDLQWGDHVWTKETSKRV